MNIASMRRRLGCERGSVALESALVMIAVMLAMLTLFHFAAAGSANESFEDAAGEALEVAAELGGTAADGHTVAAEILSTDPYVAGYSIDINRGAGDVTVTITGNSHGFVPFLETEITRTVTGPVERFIAEGDR